MHTKGKGFCILKQSNITLWQSYLTAGLLLTSLKLGEVFIGFGSKVLGIVFGIYFDIYMYKHIC